jgi:DNA-binding NarL/FixJ family response regulator
MTIRILIVDDEPLARLRIRDLLENQREVAIIGEAADGRATTKLRSSGYLDASCSTM